MNIVGGTETAGWSISIKNVLKIKKGEMDDFLFGRFNEEKIKSILIRHKKGAQRQSNKLPLESRI